MKNNTQHPIDYFVDILSEQPGEDDCRNPWQEFKNACDKIVDSCLLPSGYPQKLEIQSGLDHVLGRVYVLLRFPQLIGRHILCHVGFRRRDRNKFLPPLPQSRFSIRENESVPTVLTLDPPHPDACIGGVTIHGKYCHADIDQITASIRKILNQNGELRSFFASFAMSHPGISDNLALIDIPVSTLPGNIYLHSFLDAADTIVIPAESTFLTQESLKYLEKIRSAAQIYLFPPDLKPAHELRKRYRKLDIILGPMPDISKVQPSANANVHLELETVLKAQTTWIHKKKNQLNHFIKIATADIVNNEADSEFCKLMNERIDDASDQRATLEKIAQNYANCKDRLLQESRRLEEYLQALCDKRLQEQDLRFDAIKRNDWKITERYFFALLEAGEIARASQLANDMRQKDYPFSKILTLHLDKARNVELNSADLAELRLYSKEGLEFIQRSCIRFRSDLLLSDAEAGKLYSQKIDCQTAEEIHTLGCWKIKADKKMGEDLLRQAFSLGCEKSGDILLSVVRDRENKKSEKTLRFLARALHPEANYIYGKLCFEKYKNQKQADVHLRIAAAKGHMCALLEVARLEYHKFNNTHNNQNHKNTLRIYAHLWRENKKLFQQKDLLDFACCLHRERNFIKALEILSLCDVPHAYYLLGRMHHYGDGTAIDYNKAKEYYKKCGNHRRAQELLTKLENSIKAKQQRERIRTKSYSRKEKTTSSSSSSACFLTTATCQVMGYEDDCDVLQTFRLYRDRILAQQKGGNDLIANYYNLAPKILEKIDADKQPELVYQHMWNHYIKPAYNLLQNKQYNEAQKLYIELVTLLQNKYGLKNGGSCRVSGSF